jgi:hypothetical protein
VFSSYRARHEVAGKKAAEDGRLDMGRPQQFDGPAGWSSWLQRSTPCLYPSATSKKDRQSIKGTYSNRNGLLKKIVFSLLALATLSSVSRSGNWTPIIVIFFGLFRSDYYTIIIFATFLNLPLKF